MRPVRRLASFFLRRARFSAFPSVERSGYQAFVLALRIFLTVFWLSAWAVANMILRVFWNAFLNGAREGLPPGAPLPNFIEVMDYAVGAVTILVLVTGFVLIWALGPRRPASVHALPAPPPPPPR